VLSALVLSTITIGGHIFQLHALIAGSLLEIVGTEVIGLGLAAHAYATYFMSYSDAWFDRARARLRLEHGLVFGALLATIGIVFSVIVFVGWIANGLGSLSHEYMTLTAATFVIIGMQVFFTSFLLSILGLRRTDRG